jgi:pyruvate/2-oxoglutarate dehydrogenase complex dihydrolipoamide dehydrogenase (E3) component
MSDIIQVPPMDSWNTELVNNVHPPDWANPDPTGRYNLVVIGAGPAGLVTAAGAAGLGAKVALIEKHLVGGDCLNVGCVPSKCLIRSARAAADVRRADRFGIRVSGQVDVDFPAIMERMRKLRAHISHHDSAQRFRDLGVDIFFGPARFKDSETVVIGGQELKFYRAVIATGARAVRPEMPGLAEAGYLTNETVFNLTELPKRLVVFGAGPIGCELAQAFARFGSEVTIFQQRDQLLPKEDRDAVDILLESFTDDAITIHLATKVHEVAVENGCKVVHATGKDGDFIVPCDEILIGAGRQPNVEGLGLEGVGVEYDARGGVMVSDHLRTTNKRIFACGDICLKYKFTHTADFAARIVIQNALFPSNRNFSSLTIPWCTYTDPEIAHVGEYEAQAIDRGLEVTTYKETFDEVDRAIADGETGGFVKVHVEKGTDRILGATIVAPHAGEMISEITLAMVNGIGLGKLANVIHPYPTQAETIRRVGDAYNRTRLKPLIKAILNRFMAWEAR